MNTSLTMTDGAVLTVAGVSKTFTLHLQGGQQLPVLRDLSFDVPRGTCTVLGGESGSGKSTVMKMVYGSYATDAGRILLAHDRGVLDIATPSRGRCSRRAAARWATSASSCERCPGCRPWTWSPNR